MTKQFLVTVEYQAGQPAQDDEFLSSELKGYSEALFEFYGRGQRPAVTVRLVNTQPHVIDDLG